MKKYSFYRRGDTIKESLSSTHAASRREAAKFFAERKNLTLKEFLTIYSITK